MTQDSQNNKISLNGLLSSGWNSDKEALKEFLIDYSLIMISLGCLGIPIFSSFGSLFLEGISLLGTPLLSLTAGLSADFVIVGGLTLLSASYFSYKLFFDDKPRTIAHELEKMIETENSSIKKLVSNLDKVVELEKKLESFKIDKIKNTSNKYLDTKASEMAGLSGDINKLILELDAQKGKLANSILKQNNKFPTLVALISDTTSILKMEETLAKISLNIIRGNEKFKDIKSIKSDYMLKLENAKSHEELNKIISDLNKFSKSYDVASKNFPKAEFLTSILENLKAQHKSTIESINAEITKKSMTSDPAYIKSLNGIIKQYDEKKSKIEQNYTEALKLQAAEKNISETKTQADNDFKEMIEGFKNFLYPDKNKDSVQEENSSESKQNSTDSSEKEQAHKGEDSDTSKESTFGANQEPDLSGESSSFSDFNF